MLANLFKMLNQRRLRAVAVGLLTLSAALILQYIVGMRPCPLCIYSRVPYVLLIVSGLLAPRLIVPSLIGAVITAGYQSGVERGFWQHTCAAAADYMNALPVLCTDPARLWGLSLSDLNLAWSLLWTRYFLDARAGACSSRTRA